jgi:putative glutamine amidotransferase
MVSVIAYPSFYYQFKKFFPDLKLFLKPQDIEEADLVIFSGGEDINPEIYGQENTYSIFNSQRDAIELYALKMALDLDKKIVGVCRGHQLINAYLGGNLVQDIEKDLSLYHEGDHDLAILELDSFISRSYNGGVNSLHHQGVVKTGKGLIPTSFYNGVYESTEGKNIITTQFHPEFMEYSSEFDSHKFFSEISAWSK